MAVAHSAASESHTGTTGSTNQASFSWTHTQSGTPQGVVVFVHTINVNNFITSVTYGGLTLERVAGAVAIDTAGEPGRTDMFFLGSGLGTGNQTITVNRTNNATIMYASAATVTAGADTTWAGVQIEEENQALTPVAVDDGSVGVDSLRYAAAYYGGATPAPAGTGSTLLTSIDLGAYGNSMVRETTAGQGARNVGFNASTDDVAAVLVAIRELVARVEPITVGSFALTGIEALFTQNRAVSAGTGTFTFTGQNNALGIGYTIPATTETFSVAGQDATFTYVPATQNYTITAEAAAFTYTVQSASITAARNTVAVVETYTYTGQAATFTSTRNTVNETGAYTFTGLAAALSKNYVALTVSTNFTYTGNTANFTPQRFNVADSGNFALSGQAVTATVNYALTADTASAVFTGIPVGFNSQKRIYAVPTAYTLTGQTSAVTTARQISADSAAFAVTGIDAVLLKQTNFTLTAEQTAYNTTGTGATFTAARHLQTTSAQYTFTGQNAGLTIKVDYALTADPAALALTGNTAALLYTDKKLVANKATYTISPSSTTFKRSYALGVGSTSYTVTGININSFKGYTADLSGVVYDLDTTSVQVVTTRKVAATPQTYVFTGRPATLILPQHYVVEIGTNTYTYEGQSITLWPPGSRPRSLLPILKPPARLFRVPYRDRNGL